MKYLKALKSLIPNNGNGRWFSCFVKAVPTHIEYTDGVVLVRVPNDTYLGGLYNKSELNKNIVAGVEIPSFSCVDTYPQTDAVIPDTYDTSIALNAELLIKLLKVVKVGTVNNEVTLEFNSMNPDQPIKLTNRNNTQSSFGIIVPLITK